MRIREILRQYRRDFYAIYECQFCGHSYEDRGYDDANFHQNVIPTFKCEKCDKSISENGAELVGEYRALSTKYPEGYQI